MFHVKMKMGYEMSAKKCNKPWDRSEQPMATVCSLFLTPLPYAENKKAEETMSKIPSKTTLTTNSFILNRFQIAIQLAGYIKTMCLNTKQN